MKTETSSIETNASAAAGAPMQAAEIVVPLADRYEILTHQRFDGVDCAPQEAFRARRCGAHNPAELLAVATGVAPLARTDLLPRVKTIEQPALLRLHDWGVVDWPGGARRLALIFDRPPAPQLMRALTEVRAPMGDEELTRAVLTPVCAALQDLSTRGLYHGAIRPTNLYYSPGAAHAAVLGECVSTPPGFLQPAICETVERALAEPAGRGNGSVADDLYALGVTVAMLALGQNPLRAQSEAAQIELRIDRGSYAALIGAARIPSSLIEPLRGLLADDSVQRWRLEDLSAWLSGRRQNPRQPNPARRAQRPLHVGGAEIWNARSLATAMSRHIPEAVKLVESGEIDRWLRRNLGDPATASRVAETVAAVGPQGRGSTAFEERLATRASMALDPAAPIRFRGRSVMPQGVAGALALTFAKGEPVQPLAELISGQFPQFWLGLRTHPSPDQPMLLKSFEQAKAVIDRSTLGAGAERCVYDMIPTAPCLSDLVVRRYVNSPAALLTALETVAANPSKRPAAPIDRHIAAFLAARDRSIGEPLLAALSASNREADRHLAMLNILAAIQGRAGPEQLPKLGGWFLGLMGAVIERYHSRRTRKQLQKDMAAAAERGDLGQLQRLVDDPQTISRDQAGFEQVQAIYKALAGEIARLSSLAADRVQLERSIGREAAAVVSSGVALLLAAGIILLELGR